MLSIGQLATEMEVSPKTIRYYEGIGLLPAPKRKPNGYRVYDDGDRERLQFIRQAKTLGFSLEEIAEMLAIHGEGQKPCWYVLALLDKKLAALDQQLRALTQIRRDILALQQEASQTMTLTACVCGIIEHHTIPIVQ